MEPNSVTVQGRWVALEEAADPRSGLNTVRVACLRSGRTCREELTTLTADNAPQREVNDYKVEEWTDWKVVATRASGGGSQAVLEVSLRGNAAVKSLSARGPREGETRWRLE